MPLPERDDSQPESKAIILSDRDVQDAARLLGLLTGDAKSRDLDGPRQAGEGVASRQWLLSVARKVMRDRQLRTEYFNRAMFGETAWDILLMLYDTDSAGPRQTQATLVKRLAMPASTIQRWLDYLVKERLVRRDPHPTDRRTAFFTLLDKGRNALENYLAAIAS